TTTTTTTTTSRTTITTTTSSRTTTTTSRTTTPGTGTGQPPPVAKWGQCGGIGYTGATNCASGSTCTVQNPYYSQVRLLDLIH
ncbi:hypothetical protein H072_10814, partial [Dactylellina haptotyla CBS 200.50]